MKHLTTLALIIGLLGSIAGFLNLGNRPIYVQPHYSIEFKEQPCPWGTYWLSRMDVWREI